MTKKNFCSILRTTERKTTVTSECVEPLWTAKVIQKYMFGVRPKEACVMYETMISLQAINDVKDFVNTVMLFNYDIDL